MARGVQVKAGGWALVAVALVIVTGASDASVGLPSCPETISSSDSTLQQTYDEFRHGVESSPFARRLGRPRSCDARTDGDGAIHLRYDSASGATLEAHRDPTTESTEQRLNARGLTRRTAIDLLQRTERWAFGNRGCAITWKKPPEREPAATGRELVYRGEVCNCQARLVYGGHTLTGVIFRSAC